MTLLQVVPRHIADRVDLIGYIFLGIIAFLIFLFIRHLMSEDEPNQGEDETDEEVTSTLPTTEHARIILVGLFKRGALHSIKDEYLHFIERFLRLNAVFVEPVTEDDDKVGFTMKGKSILADEALERFHVRFYDMLPAIVKQPLGEKATLAQVTLKDLINEERFTQIVLDEFIGEEYFSFPVFYALRRRVFQNLGIDKDRFDKHPTKIKPDPVALRGTPFETLLDARIDFTIPDRFWNEHAFLAGGSGTGKTQTLQFFIKGFLDRPDPPPMFVIDSMGAMPELIAQKYGNLSDRIVVLNPSSSRPPQLNFFRLDAPPSLYFYLFKAIDQSLTPRQATMVSYLVALMQKIPGSNLDTLRNLCELQYGQKDRSAIDEYKPHIARLEPIEQDFFDRQFFGQDALVKGTKQQIANRLYTIARMGNFQKMFNAPVNEFDAGKCMDEKKIVLINTDAGNMDEASPVFGRFIIASCMAAARKKRRDLSLLIVDEAKAYMDETTERILSDARQFGLSFVQATQYLAQLPDGVKRAVLGNTAIKMAANLSYGDATILARDMRCEASFIQDMRKYDRKATEWACYVQNYTEKAIKLTVPMGVMEKMPHRPQMPPAQSAPQQAAQEARRASRSEPSSAPSQKTPSTPSPHSTTDFQRPPFFDDGPNPQPYYRTGDRVQVHINGQDHYPEGAMIVRIFAENSGGAEVDPSIFAKPGDPPHCFSETVTVPLAAIVPFKRKSPPPTDDPTKPAPF